MEPERVDLSALDPTADRLGYERMVRRIVDAAAPELARRAAARGPMAALVTSWARPAFAAAAVIAVLALGAILYTERAWGGALPEGTVAEALGVPTPAAEWLSEGRAPTRGDLVLAMERRP